MSCSSNCDDCLRKIAELKKLIYNSAYHTPLSGLSYFVSQDKHKLTRLTSYLVFNETTGEEVKVQFKRFSDYSVQVESNVLLDNHVLILS